MLYINSFQINVVTNQKTQRLCYATFFTILSHFGVIAASQICSVSRKYCAVLQNRFFSMPIIDYGLKSTLKTDIKVVTFKFIFF